MKIISNQLDLTNEDALKVFEENGFEDVDLSIYCMSKKFTGYGHYSLSVEVQKNDGSYDTINLSRTTTHMSIVDEWNEDESYFENGNSCWFDSANHVMRYVLDFIIGYEPNTELLNEWVKGEELEN